MDGEVATRFVTERLVAVEWTLDHAEAAHRLYGDREVTRYLGGLHDDDVPATRARLQAVIARNRRWGGRRGSWPLLRRSDGELIGTALLKPLPDVQQEPGDDVEIGWHLRRDCWGKGYATEAGRALVEWGFAEHGLDRLLAVVDPRNQPSRAVARRIGMTELGITREYYGGVELVLHSIDRTR